MAATESALIGREAELGSIASFLERARSRPESLVLFGPPGIGKTTVWRASLEMADARGVRVLVARPAEAEARLAFAGLIDLLERVQPAALTALPAAQTEALEVALRRVRPGTIRSDALGTSLATLGAIRELAAGGPVLIAIDDVQWLDGATARVLEFALRRLTTEPVGVFASLRATDSAQLPGLIRALPADAVEELDVGPLPLEALEELLRARLGVGFLRPTLVRIEQASGRQSLLRARDWASAAATRGAVRTRVASNPRQPDRHRARSPGGVDSCSRRRGARGRGALESNSPVG